MQSHNLLDFQLPSVFQKYAPSQCAEVLAGAKGYNLGVLWVSSMLPNIVMHTKHSELELGSHEQEGNVHSKQFISLRKYLALCCRKSELFACFPRGPGGKGLVDNPSSSILLSQAQGKLARMSQLLQSIRERPGGDTFCLFICLLWKANACAKDMGRKEAEN